MATLKSLMVSGRAQGGTPASQAADFVRYQEFSGTLAGKAPLVHRHLAADIDNLIPMLLTLLGNTLQDSTSVLWETSGTQLTSAQVRLKPNGGLLVEPQGLYVDSGTVSRPGHHHVTADIDDFAAALYQQLETLYAQSPTFEWSFDGDDISGTVRLKPASGILSTPDGLALDFGSGTNQAARGDHSHSQLHTPLTVLAGDSIDLELVGQQLTAEVRLAPFPGLIIDGTGLHADFGSGTNQIARGSHSHALLHNPVTIVSSDASLGLTISASQGLSGTVRRDPSPPGGFGKIVVGPNGISVQLGTTSDVAAAGNHGHTDATESTDGFLSATDKAHLDTLWSGSGTVPLPQSGTMDSLHVRVLYLVNPNTGQTRAIYLGDDGKVKGLGSGTL